MRGEEVRDAAQGNHAAAAATATVRYETDESERNKGEKGERITLVHRDAGAFKSGEHRCKGGQRDFKQQMKLDRGDITDWRHW